MEQSDSFKKLTDAVDLINMLEYLTEGLSGANGGMPAESLPWGGLRLTLRQTRESILSAYEELLGSGDFTSAARDGVNATSQPVTSQSLADRVQQVAPGTGAAGAGVGAAAGGSRVRELLNKVGSSTPQRAAGPTPKVTVNE